MTIPGMTCAADFQPLPGDGPTRHRSLRTDARLRWVGACRQVPTRAVAFLALLAMAAAWGSTFFLIKDLVTRIPVADLLALRFAIASRGTWPHRRPADFRCHARVTRARCSDLLYGSAQILQTAGLAHTAASVSGFVTGLYVVATPLLTAVILRRRIAASHLAGGRACHDRARRAVHSVVHASAMASC